jgi:hypothetical protein
MRLSDILLEPRGVSSSDLSLTIAFISNGVNFPDTSHLVFLNLDSSLACKEVCSSFLLLCLLSAVGVVIVDSFIRVELVRTDFGEIA